MPGAVTLTVGTHVRPVSLPGFEKPYRTSSNTMSPTCVDICDNSSRCRFGDDGTARSRSSGTLGWRTSRCRHDSCLSSCVICNVGPRRSTLLRCCGRSGSRRPRVSGSSTRANAACNIQFSGSDKWYTTSIRPTFGHLCCRFATALCGPPSRHGYLGRHLAATCAEEDRARA